MAQRSLMYYAYFRFYINSDDIESGLNDFCMEWEHMYEIGYNYKEYKCFVDNLGGFEHWVGDMQGYISQTRETGFADASPSDNVFDQTLLMGVERTFLDDITLLNGYKPSTQLLFRKITAQDAGIAHKVSFDCGISQKILHPIMYTLDMVQIQIINQVAAGFTDNSDVDSYELMIEANMALLIGTQHSLSYGTVTDFELAFNRSHNDFLHFTTPIMDTTTAYLIIDMGTTFTNIAIQGYNSWNNDATGDGRGNGSTTIQYSNNPSGGWVLLGATGNVKGDFAYNAVGVNARYVRVTSNPYLNWNSSSDIYRLMCS